MPLRFSVHDEGGRPQGSFSRDWGKEAKVDRLRDQLESAEISNEAALMQARAIVSADPENLDAQQFLATRYWDAELKDEAMSVWRPLYERITALIPKGFRGEISYGDLNNRHFLRIAHGYLLGLMYERNGVAASKLSKQLLKWNPNDNHGVRFLEPDIAFMSGKLSVAYKLYLRTAPDYPVGWYHAGRIAFLEGRFVTAITHYRRGITAIPYVAEAITGRTRLFPHLYWHATNLEDPSSATHLLEEGAIDSWTQEEIDFVDWVFNSSLVLRDRLEMAEINEALTSNRAPAERNSYIGRRYHLAASIDDHSSSAIATLITNRWGIEHWPWDRVGALSPQCRSWSAADAVEYARRRSNG